MHWHALTILTRHWLWQHSFIASYGVEVPVVSKCSSWTFICIAAYPFAEWTSTGYLDRIWNLGAHSTRCSFIPYGIAIHNVAWHFGDACMVLYRPYVMVAHRQSQWSQFWWWSASWCNACTSESGSSWTHHQAFEARRIWRGRTWSKTWWGPCPALMKITAHFVCREKPQGWWNGKFDSRIWLVIMSCELGLRE